ALPEPQPQGSQCIEQDCFALFRGPATFLAASQVCERLRGHLMTVRSSVAADVISLLLSGGGGGESPRLWIGLKHPPGCSDPGHRGPASGEPSWEEQQCATEADGFLCEFHFPAYCKPLAVRSGAPATASISVNYSTPCDKRCQHLCHRNPDVPRGYSCMCDVGYQLAADQHGCEDVDDCMQVPSPCPQLCVNTQGSFECRCHPGYELVNGECVESEDLCLGNNCEYQCQPLKETDSPPYRCICAEGFVPVPHAQHECQMFCNQTECPADCDPNYPDTCRCPEGYILDEGSVCTDIDECANGNCINALSCKNLPGTYECICGPGMVKTGNDCDPIPVIGGGGDDGGSGEPPVSPTPGVTSSPRPAGSVHSGVLIGISIASLCLVVALLALLCHLRKKQGAMQAELEYKCGVPSKEVVLQHVRTEQMPQKL
ncbi:PREDICTED: LOW QUALITY PROTEIN: thrombomodulin, partial [Myotis brandtii]